VRSYLAVPVVSRSGEVIGGLFFGHPKPGVFTARAERLLAGIAAQAAVAIDNARLYEAAQQAAANERAARADIERSSDLKDEFLANLSHELRTPLTAILGWAQMLRRRSDLDEVDVREGLEIIERNTRLQVQLIDDLLDTSRITSGKLRIDVQPVDPKTIVEAALETIQPAAQAKGIRIERILDPAAGPVSGDPGRLQQVMWNLLSNAIKFTPKQGKVQVLLERVNSHIEISVADTGIGFKPEFLEHVFERFRQAERCARPAPAKAGARPLRYICRWRWCISNRRPGNGCIRKRRARRRRAISSRPICPESRCWWWTTSPTAATWSASCSRTTAPK
jgi:signal transduction histidine kinase